MSAGPARQTLGIEHLNTDCTCRTLDQEALCKALYEAVGDPQFCKELIASHPHLVSAQPVFLTRTHADEMSATIAAIERTARLPAYQEAVLAYAPDIARFTPGPVGVFMGYDFHLSDDGPRLIEINTNAGGALINAFVAQAQRACCDEMQLGLAAAPPPEGIGDGYLASFVSEWQRQGRTTALATIAIVDEDPERQYLFPEFVLFKRRLERQDLTVVIAPPDALAHRDGALWHGPLRIELVYNRLTDFYLEAATSAALRQAYLAGDVVVSPNPRAHALFANKRNLVLLTDPDELRRFGVPEADIETLSRTIPRTREVTPENASELWASRASCFFKPVAGYGSKATYRGDKLTRRVWEQIAQGGYVAQDLVPPSTRAIALDDRREALKVDFRNFTYDSRIQLLVARLYQGQTTNFRTPGGGFAPVFVSGDADCPIHPQSGCE